jgi:hypothetical protein
MSVSGIPMARVRGVAGIGFVNLQNVSEVIRFSAYYRRAPGAKMLRAAKVWSRVIGRFLPVAQVP